ncbi:MAG: 16S rRNA (guanine(966)-N(2))-methyltransferase RsmD [Rhodobacteraceae bacterium]|nr:16S rRNA (guanine(966)-N(2))-methyltransferase RsmD [Paracoccaceae bacterium]
MRIIAGRYRGLSLAPIGPGGGRHALRPTADRVREAVFNILCGGRLGPLLEGARVLDLFAGTGALGLEALSRGATAACFIDNGRISVRLIRENLRRLGAEHHGCVMLRDATRLGACQDPAYDLVFLDPPYGKGLGEKALAAAQAGGWISPQSLVVWEENRPQHAPAGFTLQEVRSFGTTCASFLRRAAAPDP